MATAKTPFPSDEADKFVVRLPSGMRDRLKSAAEAHSRTMNAEIVSRLQQSFEPPTAQPADDPLIDVRERIEQLAAKNGVTFDLALDGAITAACNPGAPAVVYISFTPGMAFQEIRKIMEPLLDVVPKDAPVTFIIPRDP